MNDTPATDVRGRSDVVGSGDADRSPGLPIPVVMGLLGLAWLGINVAWSIGDDAPTFVSAPLSRLAPLWLWLVATTIALAIATASNWGRRPAVQWLGLVLLTYLLGSIVVELAIPLLAPAGGVPIKGPADALSFACQRCFLLVPALAMVGSYWLVGRVDSLRHLAFGNWFAAAKLPGGREVTWRRLFVAWLIVVAVPLFVLMQSTVEFAPLSQTAFLTLLLPLVGMSLLNGFAEELLFRGLLLPPIVACSGRTRGLWPQAFFFGLHHWGASHAAIENLPAALIVSLMAVVWGKSVLETNGLGWAVATHATVDFALFSSHFVSI